MVPYGSFVSKLFDSSPPFKTHKSHSSIPIFRSVISSLQLPIKTTEQNTSSPKTTCEIGWTFPIRRDCSIYLSTMILPHDRDPEDSEIELWEYWVARIKDVRAEIDEEGTNTVCHLLSNSANHFTFIGRQVWTKVQWFYNGKDVADVVKSLYVFLTSADITYLHGPDLTQQCRYSNRV